MSDDWLDDLDINDIHLDIEVTKPKKKRKKKQEPKDEKPFQLTPRPIEDELYAKFTRTGSRVPGERHGFQAIEPEKQKGPDVQRKAVIRDGKFVPTHLVKFLPAELEKATYHGLDFVGVEPIWPNLHGHLLQSLRRMV